MTTYTNNSNLPLSIGVWLAHDSYDHDARKNHISATALLKPLKQLILAARVEAKDNIPDIVSLLPSSIGTGIHDGIEKAWVTNYKESLLKLGYPQHIVDRVEVNPETLSEDTIPVYLEQRAEREIDGFIISGKFDFIGEGRVEDFKTTSVYTYINKTNDEKYIMQGSIYRWLNPEKITRDDMAIQFIFTDWQSSRTREPKYPNSRTHEYKLDLKPVSTTEAFIRRKLALIKQYWDADEEDIPSCSDEDLWRKADVYKYYKNPANTKRSTKNYEKEGEAKVRASREGGIVVKVPGEVVACRYCDAFPVCKQKDKLLSTGELNLGG